MPIQQGQGLGQSAYPNLGVVLTLARSILNDPAGSWATDAVLIPYANSAFRTVNSELGNVQAPSYIKDNVLFTLPAVVAANPDIETFLTDAGFNNGTQNFTNYAGAVLQLPPDLLVPLRLWERTPGSTEEYIEMEDVTDGGGLPAFLQGQRLRYWEWRTEGLFFLGATQDTEIKARYEAAFLDLVDATSPIPIREGQNALAFKTAELAGTARGGTGAPLAKALYDDEIEILKNRNAQREQHVGRRRIRYSRSYRGRIVV